MKRIINLNHFGLWGELRHAALQAASRELIVREAGDGHAIEVIGSRRDGDATYAGVEFCGPQSPEIEAVLMEHADRVTHI
jgi:hypothetical protein